MVFVDYQNKILSLAHRFGDYESSLAIQDDFKFWSGESYSITNNNLHPPSFSHDLLSNILRLRVCYEPRINVSSAIDNLVHSIEKGRLYTKIHSKELESILNIFTSILFSNYSPYSDSAAKFFHPVITYSKGDRKIAFYGNMGVRQHNEAWDIADQIGKTFGAIGNLQKRIPARIKNVVYPEMFCIDHKCSEAKLKIYLASQSGCIFTLVALLTYLGLNPIPYGKFAEEFEKFSGRLNFWLLTLYYHQGLLVAAKVHFYIPENLRRLTSFRQTIDIFQKAGLVEDLNSLLTFPEDDLNPLSPKRLAYPTILSLRIDHSGNIERLTQYYRLYESNDMIEKYSFNTIS